MSNNRDQGLASELVHEARAELQSNPQHPMWTRGLLPKAAFPKVNAVGPELWRWFRNDLEGLFIGHIFTDGSMKQRWWWKASQRADWGVAMMNGTRLVAGFYGHLPGPFQSIPRAELVAIVYALQVLVKPARIHTDHYNIILDIRKGRKVTCSARHQNADLWNRFWDLVADHGGLDEDLEVVCIKAHRTDGTDSAIGNGWADKLAKLGASVHEAPADAVEHVSHFRATYKQLLRWMGKSASHLDKNRDVGQTTEGGLAEQI